jgi:hypothetical protein
VGANATAHGFINLAFLNRVLGSIRMAVVGKAMNIPPQNLIDCFVPQQLQERIVAESAVALSIQAINSLSSGVKDQL